MRTLVIYHKADYDGIFCREIARKFLPDAELIGWDYGDPTPAKATIDGTEQLYMMDISVSDLMDHPKLIWIDHHASAIAKWGDERFTGKPAIQGYRIDGVAACRLAWQWFTNDIARNVMSDAAYLPAKQAYVNREVSEPYAVRLAGEYDIWDKRDPNAELFQMGLRSRKLGPDTWDILLSGPTAPEGNKQGLAEIYVETLLNAGEALQYAKREENESIIKASGFTVQWEGLTFLACNHARYSSFLFTAGLKPEHDACLGFCWRDGWWVVSLYHAPGKERHDLSTIAVKYGGGGHRGACGFRIRPLPSAFNVA